MQLYLFLSFWKLYSEWHSLILIWKSTYTIVHNLICSWLIIKNEIALISKLLFLFIWQNRKNLRFLLHEKAHFQNKKQFRMLSKIEFYRDVIDGCRQSSRKLFSRIHYCWILFSPKLIWRTRYWRIYFSEKSLSRNILVPNKHKPQNSFVVLSSKRLFSTTFYQNIYLQKHCCLLHFQRTLSPKIPSPKALLINAIPVHIWH